MKVQSMEREGYLSIFDFQVEAGRMTIDQKDKATAAWYRFEKAIRAAGFKPMSDDNDWTYYRLVEARHSIVMISLSGFPRAYVSENPYATVEEAMAPYHSRPVGSIKFVGQKCLHTKSIDRIPDMLNRIRREAIRAIEHSYEPVEGLYS